MFGAGGGGAVVLIIVTPLAFFLFLYLIYFIIDFVSNAEFRTKILTKPTVELAIFIFGVGFFTWCVYT